ncbi:hypothetical protein MMC09_006216 [Bachmanniomyces sp. S44760]|nr:hypothetical protein [Bachmanniomyces sp. S44760]
MDRDFLIMTDKYYVGRRMSYDGALCTVRFNGEIKGTKGDWLGVEWDDVERGKHSGEHQGVKYFKCESKQGNPGSFIRPSRPRDQPVDFLTAINKKYASSVEDQSTPENLNLHSEDPIEISGKIVEEIGFDKIRRQLAVLQELRVVVLDNSRIVGVSTLPVLNKNPLWSQTVLKIKETCPNIVELDLSRNLLEQGADVVGICCHLRSLKILRLNGNRFADLSTTSLEDGLVRQAFHGLLELGLDHTLISWLEAVSLTKPIVQLKSLSLGFNEYTHIPMKLQLPNLTILSLASNLLTSLAAIEPLTALPSLTTLSLRSNKISTIFIPGSKTPSSFAFQFNLTTLDLSHNSIASFDFISSLHYVFPGILSLAVSSNPLYALERLSAEESFILTLARLSPTLTILNHSKITHPQRHNAETYYLSKIGKELSSQPMSREGEIIATHPRYQALCKQYGEPNISRAPSPSYAETNNQQQSTKHKQDPASNPNTLAARLIHITFYLDPKSIFEHHLSKASNTRSQEEKERTNVEKILAIPRSSTPYRLHSLVARHFSLSPLHIRLIWETGEWDPDPSSRVRQSSQGQGPEDDMFTVPEHGFTDDEVECYEDEEEGEGEDNGEEEEQEEEVQEEEQAVKEMSVQSSITNVFNPNINPSNDKNINKIKTKKQRQAKKDKKGKYIQREVELVENLREIGWMIKGQEARIRIESR